jgi:hypothetical protein
MAWTVWLRAGPRRYFRRRQRSADRENSANRLSTGARHPLCFRHQGAQHLLRFQRPDVRHRLCFQHPAVLPHRAGFQHRRQRQVDLCLDDSRSLRRPDDCPRHRPDRDQVLANCRSWDESRCCHGSPTGRPTTGHRATSTEYGRRRETCRHLRGTSHRVHRLHLRAKCRRRRAHRHPHGRRHRRRVHRGPAFHW